MSTPIKPIAKPPESPASKNYEVASPAVVLEGVKLELMEFVDYLGLVHRVVFGKRLVVTSGKDGQHAASSLHSQGLAVDIRVRDLLPDEQVLLLSLIAYAGPSNGIACFDERALGLEAHIHLEYHGG